MNIRWIQGKDFVPILAIEKASFPEPWTKADFDRVMENKNCICRVVEDNEEVVGYMVYEYNSTSYNIINLAVAKHYRRHGVARSLLSGLIDQMEQKLEKRQILASVSDRNLGAQLFFRSLGFRAEKISRNFFGPDHHSYEFVLLRRSLKMKRKDELCRGA